jgi:hypothetical protein
MISFVPGLYDNTDRTSSRIVVGGNSGPYGLPVLGSRVMGEAVPYGEPSTFAQKMKKRLGSKAFPLPIKGPHLSYNL